jgi:inward rectifier potassium channel
LATLPTMPQRLPEPAPRNPLIDRVGFEASYFDDLYHFLLTSPWSHLLGIGAALYFGANALFAFLYMLGGDVIIGAEPGSFRDAFFFSVQTLSTIGYGVMSPKGLYGCLLVTVEAFVGIVGVAMMSGIIFSKFSRPTARVGFSDRMLLTSRDGKPCLMFRVVNERTNEVLEASIRVRMMRRETTAEGEVIARLHDLPLVRSEQPLFIMNWMVTHMIDDASPLSGETPASLDRDQVRFIVTLTGLDASISSSIHARHGYSAQDIQWGGRFADMLSPGSDGRVRFDYARFNEIEPLAPGEPAPTTRPVARHEASYEAGPSARRWGDASPPWE